MHWTIILRNWKVHILDTDDLIVVRQLNTWNVFGIQHESGFTFSTEKDIGSCLILYSVAAGCYSVGEVPFFDLICQRFQLESYDSSI